MAKISGVVIKEFVFVCEQLEKIAEEHGFDLSNDEDVTRLNLITDGERLARGVIKEGEIPEAWRSATFVEKVIATGFDYLHQVDVTIRKAPDDSNECDCCNSEARAIGFICTLNYLCGFLTAYSESEYDEFQENNFFSELGKMGAEVRHAPMAMLRAWAIELYKKKKWPSANAAAYELKEEIVSYGKTIDAVLSPSNAQKTIAAWFSKSA